jgi:hypothetical protein
MVTVTVTVTILHQCLSHQRRHQASEGTTYVFECLSRGDESVFVLLILLHHLDQSLSMVHRRHLQLHGPIVE